MTETEAEWIEKRAYALWEEEGRPHGRDSAHWQTAHQEYLAMAEGARKAKDGTRRRVAAAALAEPADPAEPTVTAAPKPSAKSKQTGKE
ncbi:DUF2934 domain-containing protein [Rhizobium sp. CG5]|uniref:DUF2934 domain-containing protein n=1 Tax=Rhizobium sp. CG5 TaxID=2726076 RepID=UPI002033E8A8|nr:DUF2934 domain-containing protein [Rhizobium sp. CG5]MCM2476299.1 DUF2934 domain-containing protein [Rhizobium sp. CG5]